MNNICIICKKKSKFFIYKLGNFPLCDDLIKIGSNKKNKVYPINLRHCRICNTIFNDHKIKETVIFPKDYHYRAKLTKDVVNGQRDLINFLIKGNNKLKNKIVLDIGCNDGALLDLLKKKGAKTIGVEPTNAAKDTNSYHDIYNTYFDEKVVKIIKKKYPIIHYIIFTNVFAHINNFHKLIKDLKKLLSCQTKLVIENHYLGSVINKFQFDTFYHEHPRTYSLTSFYYISKILGLKIEKFSFPKRYGGNIRVVYSNSLQNNKVLDIVKKEKIYLKLFKKNYLKFKKWQEIMKKRLSNFNIKYGPLKGKAFPGRAALIIKFLNLDEKKIDIIFEKKNSKKVGCYVPGTKIKIISDNLMKRNLKNYKGPIINFAWHINKEIKSYIKEKKINNKILDIINVNEIKKL